MACIVRKDRYKSGLEECPGHPGDNPAEGNRTWLALRLLLHASINLIVVCALSMSAQVRKYEHSWRKCAPGSESGRYP